jgi:hypothetical protein
VPAWRGCDRGSVLLVGKLIGGSCDRGSVGALDEACAGDAALRSQVEALLGSREGAVTFLDQPAAEQVAAWPVLSEDLPEATGPSTPADRVDPQAPAGGGGGGDKPLDFLAPSQKPPSPNSPSQCSRVLSSPVGG